MGGGVEDETMNNPVTPVNEREIALRLEYHKGYIDGFDKGYRTGLEWGREEAIRQTARRPSMDFSVKGSNEPGSTNSVATAPGENPANVNGSVSASADIDTNHKG